MNPSLLIDARKGQEAACVRPSPAAVRAHRYAMPVVREMTRADTDAQRRLVRASLLAKPL